MNNFEQASHLIKQFKGDTYLSGSRILAQSGNLVRQGGTHAAFVVRKHRGSESHLDVIRGSLADAGVEIIAEISGARPNAPREDLFRIADALKSLHYDVLVSFGGGSNIDAAKAADVLARLGGNIDDYFGTGLVSTRIRDTGKYLTPHIAFQTVASSAAHLTKYSNITDISSGQKKLIVDQAIVPPYSVFDYSITHTTPADLTMDGALDAVAHALEVLYGANNHPDYATIEAVAITGISLVVQFLPIALNDPENQQAREALCLAADLGGYAIMLGGTNGGHLTSFSLVDILSHGRACAMLNPYYTVFFAPAIERPLHVVGEIFRHAGYSSARFNTMHGHELGVAVAEAMFAFARAIHFPIALNEVDGFSQAHIERALTAAKNPQLKMKLENMPIPFSTTMIDEYMGAILEAASTGNLHLIKIMDNK